MTAQLGRYRQRQGKLNPAIGILGHYPAGDRGKPPVWVIPAEAEQQDLRGEPGLLLAATVPREAQMSDVGKQAEYEVRLLRVLFHIHDHVSGDLSLDALAEVACMSRFHWHRVFRAMTGETLADAVRRIRLLRAANALVREDHPIEEIAARYGYSGPASFARAYRAALGVAPGELREQGVQRMAELRNTPGAQPMFPVTIKDLSACSAAGVLHVGPYAELPKPFQQLGGILAA